MGNDEFDDLANAQLKFIKDRDAGRLHALGEICRGSHNWWQEGAGIPNYLLNQKYVHVVARRDLDEIMLECTRTGVEAARKGLLTGHRGTVKAGRW